MPKSDEMSHETLASTWDSMAHNGSVNRWQGKVAVNAAVQSTFNQSESGRQRPDGFELSQLLSKNLTV